jgi:hypothetical protein
VVVGGRAVSATSLISWSRRGQTSPHSLSLTPCDIEGVSVAPPPLYALLATLIDWTRGLQMCAVSGVCV